MKSFLYTLVFFSLWLSAESAFAQWSSDPNVNLAIADTSGSQELPKIAATSDGGCYVAWFDNRTSPYKVYMQRLNAQGVKQWAPQGLLVSANPQSSSLVDWDLAVDDSNNAIVVFTDTRNGGPINPFAYKITSQGTFAWGANGVQLSDSFSVFQANPKVVKTSDGNFVITWIFASTPRKVALQKLNAAGVKQWGAGPIFLSGTGTENLDYPLLVASDNGSVILQNSGYNGTAVSPSNYRIYARKLSSAGTPVWGANPDTVYGLFRVSGFFVPKIFSDGNNGAFCLWQDERGFANSTSYVQHITSAGTKMFPIDGTAGSTLAGRLHNDAWVSYTPSTGETYMFWYETNSSAQNLYGVYGQTFSTNGTRQWSDSGKAFKTLAPSTQPSFIRTFAKDSAAVVYYLEISTGQNRLVKGFKTDRNGNVLWGGVILSVSSATSGKGRLTGAFTSTGNSLLTWADSRVDANGVYAQELNFNGQLGVITGANQIGGRPEEFSLGQNYPNPFNPSTNIEFRIANFGFVSLKVFDLLGREVATLVNEAKPAGTYDVTFNANNLSSGVYFYQLQASEFVQVRKMILAK